MLVKHILLTLICLQLFFLIPAAGNTKIIIAQNGAGGPLLENTLEATTLAVSKGIQYIELPVVMSADDELILYDDLTLNGLTDVAETFPNRNREDGGYYVMDFTLSEIRQLRLRNVFETDPHTLTLGIPTLREELSLVRRLEAELGTAITIMVEIKSPWFFQDSSKDISSAILDMLTLFEYDKTDKIYLQCFDPEELRRIHRQLMPAKGIQYPLIQMIDSNEGEETKRVQSDGWQPYNYDWVFTNIGLRMVATYASAITLPIEYISNPEQSSVADKRYIEQIHKNGLQLFVYKMSNNPDPALSEAGDASAALIQNFNTDDQVNGIYIKDYQNLQEYSEHTVTKEKQRSPFFSGLDLPPPEDSNENGLSPEGSINAANGFN